MKRVTLALVVALLLVLSLAPAASAAPQRWTILGYHVVRVGETLFCIGRAYGVSPWAIASQNGIISPNHIYPGMTLAIPAAYASLPAGPTCARQFGTTPAPCTCVAYHTISYGETLTGISIHYGVSMWRIAECNGILNLNYIRAGHTLCIPGP